MSASGDGAMAQGQRHMILANWNLERASTLARRKALREQTDKIAADVWVLTETTDAFTPGLEHSCSSMGGRDELAGLDKRDDRWVTIWSKHRLQQLATSDAIRTAAARIWPVSGAPFLVYGTTLPWIGSKWRGRPWARGIIFREALKEQASDWMKLRREYPADGLYVLGDFNQDLVLPRYYGSKVNREALTKALDDCGLVALTGGDRDPIRRDSSRFACIDHICASRNSHWRPEPAVRWPNTPKPDNRISDHFGVAVTFSHR